MRQSSLGNRLSRIRSGIFGPTELAKRGGPADVEPVIYKGVKYVAVHWGLARGLAQNGGYVEALDQKTGRQIWLLRIYSTTYDNREKDVQDVFITKLTIESGKLIVTNERNEKFSVDLRTRVIRKID